MVMTIGPAGSRTRQAGLIGTYAITTLAGAGTAASLTLGLGYLLGGASSRACLTFLLLVVSLGLLRDVGVPAPVPYRDRQVPEGWRRRFPIGVAVAAYGAVLGFGFATRYTTSVPLAFMADLVLVRSLWIVAAGVAIYAISRTLTVQSGRISPGSVVAGVVAAIRADQPRRWARQLVALAATGSVLVLVLVRV